MSGGTGTVGSANVTDVAVACTKTYSVGGTVSGLSGTVVLQDNGGDDLSVSRTGAFTFATRLATGAGYKVTVKSSPSGQSCSVSGGTGTVGSANVTERRGQLHQPSTYSVGGSVSGLSGAVVLQDNGGDDLSVSGDGAFTFATRLATGVGYNVTVKTNPSGQSCSVSGGAGTVGFGERDGRCGELHRLVWECRRRMISIGGMVGWVLVGWRWVMVGCRSFLSGWWGLRVVARVMFGWLRVMAAISIRRLR